MDSLKLSTLRQMRLANVRHAIELLENARDALRLAQSQTAALGVNHTDCGDAAKQIDDLLSSDGGECGLKPLFAKYANCASYEEALASMSRRIDEIRIDNEGGSGTVASMPRNITGHTPADEGIRAACADDARRARRRRMRVEVEGRESYRFSHGHYPRGDGAWAFEIRTTKGREQFWFNGTYGQAVQQAKRKAVDLGVSSVKVLP